MVCRLTGTDCGWGSKAHLARQRGKGRKVLSPQGPLRRGKGAPAPAAQAAPKSPVDNLPGSTVPYDPAAFPKPYL